MFGAEGQGLTIVQEENRSDTAGEVEVMHDRGSSKECQGLGGGKKELTIGKGAKKRRGWAEYLRSGHLVLPPLSVWTHQRRSSRPPFVLFVFQVSKGMTRGVAVAAVEVGEPLQAEKRKIGGEFGAVRPQVNKLV